MTATACNRIQDAELAAGIRAIHFETLLELNACLRGVCPSCEEGLHGEPILRDATNDVPLLICHCACHGTEAAR